MAQAPAALFAELSAHLQAVDEDPTTTLDADLLEKCALFASTADYRARIWQETGPLFLQIAALLPKLQQDPSPLIHFVVKLTAPYRFEHIKDVDFEIGLDLQATPVHALILTLLEKAAAGSNDAQALANRPTVMAAVVRLWLCTSNTGVATQAGDLLISLLRASKNEPATVSGEAPLHTYGAGPMWRRLFADRDIVALYYHYTSLKTLPSPPLPFLSKRDKTVSQARLLTWLPKVGALDWSTITSSLGLDIEKEVGLAEGQGLLHYASSKMVDTEDDILMHMTLINFFRDLIVTVKTKPHLTHYDSSLSLDFLKEQNIHKHIIDFHISDNPGLDHSFLSPRTAQYISEYASTYPENFENSAELPAVRTYLHRNIRKCEPHDLSILAAMPRATLIPRNGTGLAWDDCILLDIPLTRTNPDALKTLAAVFHGPPKQEITFPQIETIGLDVKRIEIESVFARLLTSQYYSKHPSLFSDLVTHASTIAMKENALAALVLLRAIITSSWSTTPLPDLIPASNRTYTHLQNFPRTGLDLILDPARSGSVLPALLKPATTFSNLVGGRGDAENAAYQVAVARFDVLKALGQRLEQDGGRDDVLQMIRRRVSEGPWGVGGSGGSRIGTLDL
ncbi:uncharacterized protein CC84DRAFT_1087491 [Paraphaeosphaeria sporulosa]|uniref:Uncharacterized protein n=1 Tax=Paraphaeosphaeria sporulosa TaxID=1460663 RepID=A0A177CLP3_9PLEO|nr:uncharacterized protein CC84DRAFT_1087491 [Paraphaeosphaeria sporulosa]OAG08226.1 hypothetical protein CC84DRAFT_1087491 [Paraphaeosphaeria sporulosa]